MSGMWAEMAEMADVLNDALPTALLNNHPNSLANFHFNHSWIQLVRAYHHSSQCLQNHELLDLIHSIRRLQLDRTPIHIHHPLNLPSDQGMSPKKAHEVSRMTSYVLHLLQVNNIHAIRIVDIGAGQGYLTRALKYHLPKSHILALDADQDQIRGAQQWERRLLPNATPSITHKTILIAPQTLLDTVNEWVAAESSAQPVPVLLVALHACGSLTPDILRSFISSVKTPHPSWYPVGVVAVGCCYNLMHPGDFPLSKSNPKPLTLPISAYHLAAQVPSQWLIPGSDPPAPHPSVVLAVRKVTWRALLGKALVNATPVEKPLAPVNKSKPASVPARWPRRPEAWKPQKPFTSPTEDTNCTGQNPTLLRLGRLKDSAYTNGWPAFLHITEERLKVKFSADAFDLLERESDDLVRNLEVLHVMRCLLGPLIETVILRDRVEWVKEELEFGQEERLNIKLVNLFDQSTGSARNVAIVVAPTIPDYDT